jgi:hypothetical protein
MKIVALMGTTALLFVFGGAAISHSQEKGKEEKAPPKQEEKQQAPPKQESKPVVPQKQQAQKAAPAQQHAAPVKQQAQPQKQAPAQAAHASTTQPAAHATTNQSAAHATANQPAAHAQTTQVARTQQTAHTQTRAQVQQTRITNHTQIATVSVQSGRYAGTGGRIPDDRFRASFGSSHYFQISTPFIVGGYSRFNYGGFAFGLYQPWPYGWYYTDDVYVDYLDGNYYLYDRVHPGGRIQINVVI